MGATESLHMLSLGLNGLRAHAQAFAPLQERKPNASKRLELAAALQPYYHDGAFGSSAAKGRSSGGGGGGGKGGSSAKSVRFSAQEEKWLREAHGIFASKFGEVSKRGKKGEVSWYEKALERFAFHPTRTAQSLKQKWHIMGGGRSK